MTPADLLDRYRAHLRHRLADCRVPEHLQSGLLAYLTERRPVGRFLTAVLENNLLEAVQRADPASDAALRNIVNFLSWHAPALAWGSVDHVAAWLADEAPVSMPFDITVDRAVSLTTFDAGRREHTPRGLGRPTTRCTSGDVPRARRTRRRID